MNEIILYHGTSSVNNSSIFADGIISPRKDRGNWFKDYQHPSLENHIYFTALEDSYDFHALRTACYTGGDCTILTVALTKENMYPDENFFVTKKQGDIMIPDMLEMQQKVLENKECWFESLKKCNAASFKGSIPTNKILEVKTYPKKDSMYYSFIEGTKETLDDFDRSFRVMMAVNDSGWFKEFPDITHEKIMKNITIKHPNERDSVVYLFGKFIDIKWT